MHLVKDSKDKLQASLGVMKSDVSHASRSEYILEHLINKNDDQKLQMLKDIEQCLGMLHDNPDYLQPVEIINIAFQKKYGKDIPKNIKLGLKMSSERYNCIYLLGGGYGWLMKIHDILQQMEICEGCAQQHLQHGTDRCELLESFQEMQQQLRGRLDILNSMYRLLEIIMEYWPPFPPVRSLCVEATIYFLVWCICIGN